MCIGIQRWGTRWDGTTPTDTRSQRSRTSRRGGQLLTRARSPPCKNGLPIRVPRRPLFRTVAPYAQRQPLSQQNNSRASASFHTGYKRHRVNQRPDPQSGQRPRPLPHRAGRPQMRLPRADEPGPHRHRTETLDQPLEGRLERLRDHLRRTPVRRPYLDLKISYTEILTAIQVRFAGTSVG